VRGEAAATLHAAAYVYDDLSPETATKLREEILARFPDSGEAEWAQIEEIRRLRRTLDEVKPKGGEARAAAEQALAAALDAFIARPRHQSPTLLGEAHTWRYFLVKEDANASPESLLAAAQGFAAHERRYNLHLFADAATMLAERTPYPAEAEAIAREALHLAGLQSAGAAPSEAEAEQQRGLRVVLLCGLGAALQAQGRFAEARATLDEAHALDEGRHVEPFLRLAALAEAEGQPAEAERHLLAALKTQYYTDRVAEALKGLHRRRHGSERGFAQYRARVDRELLEERRAAVLATRSAEPQPLVPFALPRLGGGEVRSDDLAGRLAVINLWATHCHPCVAELPALQQLADGFAGARDVVITTINTEALTDPLPAWLAERGLRLEVLLGGAWYFEAGYRAIPTTLFVDPQGRVVFVKVGGTDRLVEEFTWRIEAMRQDARRGRAGLERARTRG
jgi:thiol-disulfide isomerase/thioredoxin